MSDITNTTSTTGTPAPGASAAKSRARAPKASPADKADASVSTTIDAELKDLLHQRAEEEERTEAVLFRRALRAYMKDWKPGQDEG